MNKELNENLTERLAISFLLFEKYAIKGIWKSIALPGLLGEYKVSNEIVGLTGVGGQAV